MKSFPIGYYNFSKDEALNFQLNRFYSNRSLSYEELMEIELDPGENLEENTFRIVDIRGSQYGYGSSDLEYTGIFPVITTSPMALYW